MSSCPACGSANRDDAKFCSECGRSLEAATDLREERKVVTVLFADLVGFTSLAESLDPEEVRAVLAPYHAQLRDELERFGGTVEKFIGDAVMALFGAPVAHEDDPERAVRAALRIRDALAEEGRLNVRIGITTGEVLVTLGARPSEGEGMAAGDVVNTAARVQSAAPTDGILVDETTYRATRDLIEYQRVEPVAAKGKTEPVPVWEVVAVRARMGVDVGVRSGAELVGRQEEFRLLSDALARVRRGREPQLVTITGVPGIGKSRLVYELFKSVEAGSELTYWRQGRCLSYGEGVTFWALAEVVKSHAGVLETDDARTAEDKLRRAVREALGEGPEAEWALRHLRPLVGLGSHGELSSDHRGEAFAAWRRLFEALAESHPLVLVVEDIQWADDGLLDFLEELARRTTGVPLLVVCTGRPEVFDRRPGWGGGRLNAITVSLAPLDDEETAELVSAHATRSVLRDDVRVQLLARAGGNPLYAEEFARMAAERGANGDLQVPESIQGIIAARLDLLLADEKELLQNAAVVGKLFWSGAVQALGSDAVESRLRLLEERDFVRRVRRSSVQGEEEYAFRHILTRDVAYAQIPRARRAEKHALAATWIESLSNDRSDDKAEMLAFHYGSALELGRTAGVQQEGLEQRARIALRDAGDHALSLNAFTAAARFYGSALELWPDDHDRLILLYRYGSALWHAEARGREELVAARDGLRAAGDVDRAVEAVLTLSQLDWMRGRQEDSLVHLDDALELVHGRPLSRAKARVLTTVARYRSLAGYHDWNHHAEEALELAERLDDDELRVGALITLGSNQSLGDPLLHADKLQRAIELARVLNSPEIIRAYNNLAYLMWRAGQTERALALSNECTRAAEQFGDFVMLRFTQAGLQLTLALKRGAWDQVASFADEFLASLEGSDYQEGNARKHRARIRFARDDVSGAIADIEVAIRAARRVGDPQRLIPDLAVASRVLAEAGQRGEAEAFADELVGAIHSFDYPLTFELADIAVGFRLLERHAELDELLRRAPRTPWAAAARHYAAGDFAAAASAYTELGVPAEEADARIRAGQSLVAQGRDDEAAEHLRKALAFFEAAGAPRYIREVQALSGVALKRSD